MTIDAVIFDMDGVLIDSEPQWQEAREIVFADLGLHDAMKNDARFLGLRPDMIASAILADFPDVGATGKEIEDALNETAERLVKAKSRAMPGAVAFVEDAARSGLPFGLCSSSSLSQIDMSLEKLGLSDLIAVRHSTWDEAYSKPHPAAYLTTAARLGVDPQRTLVFEDSPPGAIAAKAARMIVCALPEPGHPKPSVFDFCDLRLPGLQGMTLSAVIECISG